MGQEQRFESASLDWHFFEGLQGFELPDEVKAYLLLTLVDWARKPPEGGPLALEWLSALEIPSRPRFRKVGDLALYRSRGGTDYAAVVAASAYNSLPGLVYRQLAVHMMVACKAVRSLTGAPTP